MSVVKSKRGRSKFEVLVKANELAAFTIRICSNEKNFPKRYRWTITSTAIYNRIALDVASVTIKHCRTDKDGRYIEDIDSNLNECLTLSANIDQTSRSFIDSGADQYVWYALPSRYGTPVFNVGGFDGGFAKVSTLDFMNLSGYTEEYTVYRSDNSNIGKKTVKVT